MDPLLILVGKPEKGFQDRPTHFPNPLMLDEVDVCDYIKVLIF